MKSDITLDSEDCVYTGQAEKCDGSCMNWEVEEDEISS